MDKLPTAKELKKLADACRKAGIKSFKGYGVEFTLSDDAPVSTYKRKQAPKTAPDFTPDKPFENDSLSDEQLLYWSTQSIPGLDENSGDNTAS